jgi:ATP-dependent Clp protease ATP-binding subunit ClpA
MFERFTRAARDVVLHAQEEAAELGDSRIGTEHLLLGVARGDSTVLATLGIDVAALRAAIADVPRDGLDAAALATIGIDLDAVRRSAEESFGPGALAGRRRSRRRGGISCQRPFSACAKRALERSLREALGLRDRHIGPDHILLALAREPHTSAADALRRCGTTPDAVRTATLAARRDAA